jgi:hypothetical protein
MKDCNTIPLFRLEEKLPELAKFLRALFFSEHRKDLADQIPDLQVFDRCRCGADHCSTVYTIPGGPWPDQGGAAFHTANGIDVILDTSAGKIACIEILYFDELRKKLLKLMPPEPDEEDRAREEG